jgi:hypothetical protein
MVGVDRMHVLMSTRAPESGRSKIHLQAAVGFDVSLSLIQVIASCRTSANARLGVRIRTAWDGLGTYHGKIQFNHARRPSGVASLLLSREGALLEAMGPSSVLAWLPQGARSHPRAVPVPESTPANGRRAGAAKARHAAGRVAHSEDVTGRLGRPAGQGEAGRGTGPG